MSDVRIVPGCNYHTTWQSDKCMRFVLDRVEGSKAHLRTRTTGKNFTTNVSDLIFIESKHNKRKADLLENKSLKPNYSKYGNY